MELDENHGNTHLGYWFQVPPN